MLQRVQSLFLLGVAICMTLVLFFPVWEKYSDDGSEKMVLDAMALEHQKVQEGKNDMISSQQTVAIAALAALSIATAFYSIFRYDNRLTQIKLNALNSLLMASCVGVELFYTFGAEDKLAPEMQGEYDLGFFLPCIALVFNVLANRYIRRDEKLVQSVDRIR